MTVRRLTSMFALAIVLVFGATGTASACDGVKGKWCGKKHSTTYDKKAIRRVAKSRGYGSANTKRLLWIAKRESHYHNLSKNGPCKGMFQVNTRKPKSTWANPYWNTNRAITYIKKRYGSPAGAIRHIRRYGWY